MFRSVVCLFLSFALCVSFSTQARQSHENRHKSITTEVFEVQVPQAWGIQIEEARGQLGAGIKKSSKSYLSPWLMIEYCVFRDHEGNSAVKRCDEPLAKCPTETEFHSLHVDDKFMSAWLPITTSSSSETLRYSRKSVSPSGGAMQLLSCSAKGVATVSLVYEDKQDLVGLEKVMMSFRWR
ncbi:MAG: hypothetical protein E6Q34_10810 [Burkholderiaceae bacterium]|nr:MAG: hypothetical protein E6Q34_10810 [Burkholderiaceae bacterium]